ncbi:MAG: ATP-binding protein, partial [Acidimicrobiia bacterium]
VVVVDAGRRETRLAVRTAGDVIGEMALLRPEPRMATIRATGEATLVRIPSQAFEAVIDSSPTAARALFSALLDRWLETRERTRQSERMAQLGTLTAGVAHELNNPAAAVRRAADQLAFAVERLLVGVVDSGLPGEALAEVVTLAAADREVPVGSLERADREADLEGWLEDRGVGEAWTLAADLVEVGVTVDDLDELAAVAGDADIQPLVELVGGVSAVARLTAEIASGASRLSDIVGALKSYSYLDQAPIQEVDVHRGIDDSLLILRSRLSEIDVVRDYGEAIPAITAHGSELNQVWTNLFDNAIDALGGVDGATLRIRTSVDGDEVVVEVTDNGPGIPPDAQRQVFDSFFTTKDLGKGTGLGLSISQRIVVVDHGGAMSVSSEPGRTTFEVRLPTATTD